MPQTVGDAELPKASRTRRQMSELGEIQAHRDVLREVREHAERILDAYLVDGKKGPEACLDSAFAVRGAKAS